MSNEELVKEIQSGINPQENMAQLYFQNIGLLRNICLKFAHNEEMEDLLQEAFFGLYEAVNHYESGSDVLFMTYAPYWIRQRLRFYTINNGHLIRIPMHALEKVKLDVCSLDCPAGEEGEETLCDFIQADLSVENDVCDKLYENYTKNELWGIVEQYTSTLERNVLIDRFKNNLSYREIGIAYNISGAKVRDIEHKALRRMKIGKIKRELLQKFDIVDCGMYRSGLKKFTKHENISTVEYIAIRRAEIQENYEKRLKEYGIV